MIRAADGVVTDAAIDAIQGAEAIGLPTPRELLSAGLKTALDSRGATRRGVRLGAEAAKILAGRSTVAPDPKDWRFKDPPGTRTRRSGGSCSCTSRRRTRSSASRATPTSSGATPSARSSSPR